MADKEVKKEDKKVKQTLKKTKQRRPYVHIDTFLLTAVPYFKLSKMQAQGFKNRMNGKHYQRDEQVFVDELKKYLNVK